MADRRQSWKINGRKKKAAHTEYFLFLFSFFNPTLSSFYITRRRRGFWFNCPYWTERKNCCHPSCCCCCRTGLFFLVNFWCFPWPRCLRRTILWERKGRVKLVCHQIAGPHSRMTFNCGKHTPVYTPDMCNSRKHGRLYTPSFTAVWIELVISGVSVHFSCRPARPQTPLFWLTFANVWPSHLLATAIGAASWPTELNNVAVCMRRH